MFAATPSPSTPSPNCAFTGFLVVFVAESFDLEWPALGFTLVFGDVRTEGRQPARLGQAGDRLLWFSVFSDFRYRTHCVFVRKGVVRSEKVRCATCGGGCEILAS